MGGRYLISGVQLGMLRTINSETERKKIIDDIINKQFIHYSDNEIEKDLEDILNHYSQAKHENL